MSQGDTVFVEEPIYDRTITLFRRHQVNLVGIPMESDGFNIEFPAERLEVVVSNVLYVIPDFQKPCGITTSSSRREIIVELADGYGLLIVEDSPYRTLRYQLSGLATMLSMGPSESFIFQQGA